MSHSEAHRTCPVCATVVRANQVRVRMSRVAILLYGLVVPAGVLGYWISYKLGLFENVARRDAGLIAVVLMAPLLYLAWRLPKIRVVRCPTCKFEQCAPLRRRR
ncbi:MAG: hypothetical protein QNJ90_06350 [Planctomycetota bacterium]|nr:hypothetical protein [Planctomycetota bacterium]